MNNLFVIDTNAIISYFSNIFFVRSTIKRRTLNIIKKAFQQYSSVRISIPSVCFIEIHDKFCINEEDLERIKHEVLVPIINCPNIEIRECNIEILKIFISIDDNIENIENHDKIIMSTAIELNAPLITSDEKITRYFRTQNNVTVIK